MSPRFVFHLTTVDGFGTELNSLLTSGGFSEKKIFGENFRRIFFFINGYALIKDNKVESFPLLFVFQLRRGDSIVIELNSLVTNGGFIETKSFIEHRKRIFFPLFIQIH